MRIHHILMTLSKMTPHCSSTDRHASAGHRGSYGSLGFAQRGVCCFRPRGPPRPPGPAQPALLTPLVSFLPAPATSPVTASQPALCTTHRHVSFQKQARDEDQDPEGSSPVWEFRELLDESARRSLLCVKHCHIVTYLTAFDLNLGLAFSGYQVWEKI